MNCNICLSKHTTFLYKFPFFEIYKCNDCNTSFANKKLSKKDFDRIYSETYYDSWKGTKSELSDEVKNQVRKMKLKTFSNYLNLIPKNKKKANKKLLDVGCATGFLLEKAQEFGYECFGVEYSKFAAKEAAKKFPDKIFCGSLYGAHYKTSEYDVVTLIDLIEHVEDPQKLMSEVKRILKPSGYLLIVTPNIQSLWAKLLKRNWTNFKEEHLFYFSPYSINFLVKYKKLKVIYQTPVTKFLTLNYIYSHFKSYPTPILGLVSQVFTILPDKIRNYPFPIKTGDYLILARKE